MTRLTPLLLALLLVWAPPAGAVDCANTVTTVDMVNCAGQAHAAADARLNAAYKALRARSDDQGKTLLRDAQRAWIAFRDKTCAWERDLARGGTMTSVIGAQCMATVTERRAAELEAALQY